MAEPGQTEHSSKDIFFVTGLKRVLGLTPPTPEEIRARNEKEFQGLTIELEKKGRGGKVVLTVGYSATHHLGYMFEHQPSTVQRGFLVGEEATSIYEKLRDLKPKVPVILVMDTQLPVGINKNGEEIAGQIAQTSQEKGWPLPLLVMVRGNDNPVEPALIKTYGTSFLGSVKSNNLKESELRTIFLGIDRRIQDSKPFHRSEVSFDLLDKVAKVMQTDKTQDVQTALGELSKNEGKKGVVLIVDDDPKYKTPDFQKSLEAHAQQASIGYVIRTALSGREAAAFYREFRKQAPVEKLVMVLDGSLGSDDRITGVQHGLDVADYIDEVSRKNKWPVPFFVGGSSDKQPNQEIENEYPANYLGDLYHDKETTLAAILLKL